MNPLAVAAPKVDQMAQWHAVADLPASARSPQTGRAIVAAALAGWDRDDLIEDAALVASELGVDDHQGGNRVWVDIDAQR